MRAIGTALFATCTACAQGDVIIHSRSTDFYSSYTVGGSAPAGLTSFDDHAYVNQLRPTGTGVVDLVTFHNEHFTSTASPNLISAQMRGSASYFRLDRNHLVDSSTHSSWFAVVFEVTQSVTATTITFNGSISPRTFEGPITGFTFRIVNVTTGQTTFDVLEDAPPVDGQPGSGWRAANWDHVSWSGLLTPGRYVLTTQAHHENVTDDRYGGTGNTTVAFSMTFGPAVAPALAPTPSTAALLTLACVGSLRRRRQITGADE